MNSNRGFLILGVLIAIVNLTFTAYAVIKIGFDPLIISFIVCMFVAVSCLSAILMAPTFTSAIADRFLTPLYYSKSEFTEPPNELYELAAFKIKRGTYDEALTLYERIYTRYKGQYTALIGAIVVSAQYMGDAEKARSLAAEGCKRFKKHKATIEESLTLAEQGAYAYEDESSQDTRVRNVPKFPPQATA